MSPETSALDRILARPTLPALDGFRMLAVMAVVLGHAGTTGILGARHGVAGFFVLSGFLITWLLLAEHERTGSVSLRGFYIRRALRIFPAYYAFLAFSIAVDLMRGDDRILPLIWPGVFYWVNYANAWYGHSTASIAHAWSLAIEEQFYLLWPLLFLALAGRPRRWMIATLAILIAASSTWRTVAFGLLGWSADYAYNAFETRIDNLAIGCLMAVLLRSAGPRRLAASLAAHPVLPLVTIGLLHLSSSIPSGVYQFGPAFTVDALLLAVLMVQLLQLTATPPWRWLDSRVSVYLGRISYPVYLWHQWGLGLADKVHAPAGVLHLATGVGFTLALAAASYHFLETPFLRLKQRFANASR